MSYEDTATRVAQEKSCASGEDDDRSAAGVARRPGCGITGILLGADFGLDCHVINLRRIFGIFLATAGRNSFGRVHWWFARGTFWAERD